MLFLKFFRLDSMLSGTPEVLVREFLSLHALRFRIALPVLRALLLVIVRTRSSFFPFLSYLSFCGAPSSRPPGEHVGISDSFPEHLIICAAALPTINLCPIFCCLKAVHYLLVLGRTLIVLSMFAAVQRI